jgi:glycosyltransferase involved in cell wall biosynthesis
MTPVNVGTPAVSIMMPAYNAERYVARAIESVLAQSFSDWELVIVDDGSTDRTAAIAASYQDARIIVVHKDNGGEASARNVALGAMHGEHVAFLDADDEWLPDHLAAAVGYLGHHGEHAGVYSDGWYVTDNGRQLAALSSRRRGPMSGRLFDEVVRGPDVFGPPLCVVLRREPVVKHYLWFDEDIVIGSDWDFFMRFSDVGTFGYVDRATCRYRIHSTSITTRVGADKRALELAKCRTKAIRMPNFQRCPLDVRFNVFHDLLVNLLREHPEQQEAAAGWPEFEALPPAEQGRLLRLMASKAIVAARLHPFVHEWLKRSCQLNCGDRRAALLLAVYRASPRLCRLGLRVRTAGQYDPVSKPPFADLEVTRA